MLLSKLNNTASFLDMLEKNFERYKEEEQPGQTNAFIFLADDVFDFDYISPFLCRGIVTRLIEVIMKLNNKTTLLNKGAEAYQRHIELLNTSFFRDRFDWATSTRTVWWEQSQRNHTPGYLEYDNATLRSIEFNVVVDKSGKEVSTWTYFMEALIQFVKKYRKEEFLQNLEYAFMISNYCGDKASFIKTEFQLNVGKSALTHLASLVLKSKTNEPWTQEESETMLLFKSNNHLGIPFEPVFDYEYDLYLEAIFEFIDNSKTN